MTLQRDYRGERENYDELERAYEELSDLVESLRKSNGTLLDELSEQEESNNALRNLSADLLYEVDRLNDSLAREVDSVDGLAALVDDLKTENQELSALYIDAQARANSWFEAAKTYCRAHKYEMELHIATGERADWLTAELLDRAEAAEARAEEAERERADLRTEWNSLRNSIRTAVNGGALDNPVDGLALDVRDLYRRLEDADADRDDYAARLRAVDKSWTRLAAERDSWKQRAEKAEEANRYLDRDLRHSREDYEALNAAYDLMESERGRWYRTWSNVAGELDELKAALRTLGGDRD